MTLHQFETAMENFIHLLFIKNDNSFPSFDFVRKKVEDYARSILPIGVPLNDLIIEEEFYNRTVFTFDIYSPAVGNMPVRVSIKSRIELIKDYQRYLDTWKALNA